MNKIWNHKLIVTVVKKGLARKVVEASKKAGAEGGTVVFARGTGIHEFKTFLGIQIQPEKEVVLTLVTSNQIEMVLSAIENSAKLYKPGNGIGFVVDTKKIAGICHILK
ncbi:P-II family nitrogen regulator [Bacillus sp. Marseille-Q3570]|uniref:P-II family nitrogen regulator n=1 Tax=Bacillus sp. Marseille-Q3570 TaxID=2963522 RepID=UPI0021B7E237|nr:P-II family nitrogen regulator [Bacillus sp. Marseille-Q3570]